MCPSAVAQKVSVVILEYAGPGWKTIGDAEKFPRSSAGFHGGQRAGSRPFFQVYLTPYQGTGCRPPCVKEIAMDEGFERMAKPSAAVIDGRAGFRIHAPLGMLSKADVVERR